MCNYFKAKVIRKIGLSYMGRRWCDRGGAALLGVGGGVIIGGHGRTPTPQGGYLSGEEGGPRPRGPKG